MRDVDLILDERKSTLMVMVVLSFVGLILFLIFRFEKPHRTSKVDVSTEELVILDEKAGQNYEQETDQVVNKPLQENNREIAPENYSIYYNQIYDYGFIYPEYGTVRNLYVGKNPDANQTGLTDDREIYNSRVPNLEYFNSSVELSVGNATVKIVYSPEKTESLHHLFFNTKGAKISEYELMISHNRVPVSSFIEEESNSKNEVGKIENSYLRYLDFDVYINNTELITNEEDMLNYKDQKEYIAKVLSTFIYPQKVDTDARRVKGNLKLVGMGCGMFYYTNTAEDEEYGATCLLKDGDEIVGYMLQDKNFCLMCVHSFGKKIGDKQYVIGGGGDDGMHWAYLYEYDLKTKAFNFIKSATIWGKEFEANYGGYKPNEQSKYDEIINLYAEPYVE